MEPMFSQSAQQLVESSRMCTCLQCLSNCRCMVLIAASGFLANPGPPHVKYVSQLEHLPCSPDLSFWVISRCGFFMLQVSPSQGVPVRWIFRPYHYRSWLGSGDGDGAGRCARPTSLTDDCEQRPRPYRRCLLRRRA
jgi:hypothetical protein